MFIVKHKKTFIGISTGLVVVSLILLFTFGLNVSIDFKGGALMEVAYTVPRPTQATLQQALKTTSLGPVLLQPTGDSGYIVKLRDLSDAEHTLLLNTLSQSNPNGMKEISFDSIGPSVGRELTRKAIVAVILISLAIICFIAYAFRKVSGLHSNKGGVSSWKYGVIAIVTLFHDVAIPVGIFVIMSKFYGATMDTLFVVAVLTILGLSVSDTIVVFDRIRENLRDQSNIGMPFAQVVGRSLEQSYVRSICTSLTVILVLLALVFFGPVSTKYFAIMLTAGMFFGTYSSIFLASPLLVLVEERQKLKK
jgi:preprotein translocase subunit SecF